MQSHPSKFDPARKKSAFSLVEMLVVIAIISILMTAGSIGLSGMAGKGVTSGVATAESLFDEARSTAVGRNIRSCVLIAKTLTNNTSEDLRRILVAYEEVDANGLPTSPPTQEPNWVLSSRGALLPEQVYFSQELSKQDHAANSGAIDEIPSSKIKGVKSAYQGTYFIYQFNDQGIAKRQGASFIIGSGSRVTSKAATSQPPRVTASAKRDFGGFVIWRSGRSSVFRSPNQMGTSVMNLKPGDKY